MCHQEDESGVVASSTVPDSAPSRSPGVVKAKASSIIMNSLITSMLKMDHLELEFFRT